MDVTVGTLPTDGSGRAVASNESPSQGLGVALSGITPNIRQQLDLPETARGAVITEVKPGSAADQAGLQAGDLITGVGDRAVTGTADASRAIRDQLKTNQAVALRILRNGEPVFVAVAPSSDSQGNDSQDDGNG
jgi:serine protease Do